MDIKGEFSLVAFNYVAINRIKNVKRALIPLHVETFSTFRNVSLVMIEWIKKEVISNLFAYILLDCQLFYTTVSADQWSM